MSFLVYSAKRDDLVGSALSEVSQKGELGLSAHAWELLAEFDRDPSSCGIWLDLANEIRDSNAFAIVESAWVIHLEKATGHDPMCLTERERRKKFSSAKVYGTHLETR